ncbi:ATP-binding protein [Calothrix sp. FACHB-156]|nr:ATP-binding protein [Calothrix sp. FACHB-156]
MKNIQITSLGIIQALKKHHNYLSSIAGYVWNGFDAKATQVELVIIYDNAGQITKIKILDNGTGITDTSKFQPIFESNKVNHSNEPRHLSSIHGKDGIGRLTFFNFAISATWETVYEFLGKNYTYNIDITSENLDLYTVSNTLETLNPTGTSVYFEGIHSIDSETFEKEVQDFLYKEFSWFLELNSEKKFIIKINGLELDYRNNFIKESQEIQHEIAGYSFLIKFIQWKENLNREYSRYYLINTHGDEKYTETTTLNKKADNFSHSIFIKSKFFNKEHFFPYTTSLQKQSEDGIIFHQLIAYINQYLKNKRKLFLKSSSNQIIESFEKSGAFPVFNTNNVWDKYRKSELEGFIKELYQVEPKIFVSLNLEQKKILIRFLNLILDSDERDRLIEVLGEITTLESDELEHLSQSLKVTKLSNIIKTVKLIEDRYKAIEELKSLVFNKELNANERDHIQKFIENHYWIFGEQYHLVTAAEQKFEKALRRYIYHLTGETNVISIDHHDKNKEMDIFMVRQLLNDSFINNVVVELKSPKIKLGSKELEQVKKYMSVILEQNEFNASNMTWEFYLIGNDFDQNGYIEREIKNSKHHGEKSLVYSVDNYKIYVKRWSEIFTEFELKHKFLYEKLELERTKLTISNTSADEIVSNVRSNSAVQAQQVILPDD